MSKNQGNCFARASVYGHKEKTMKRFITTRGQLKANGPVYLCGPMTKLTNYNYDSFNWLAGEMEKAGIEVQNPAARSATAFTRAAHLEEDIQMLMKSRSIILLPGWHKAEGARMETKIAWETERKFALSWELFILPTKLVNFYRSVEFQNYLHSNDNHEPFLDERNSHAALAECVWGDTQ